MQSNPLFQMKELVSLEASSVRFSDQLQVQSMSQNQPQNISHQQESFFYEANDIKNKFFQLKSTFPKIVQQIQAAKQQVLGLSFKTINKIMSQVHLKNKEVLNLKIDLQKSKQIQSSMKNQVIQLKDMINQFVGSYSKQISSKEKQISSLKELMKSNFTSPRNICRSCQNKIRKNPESLICNNQTNANFQQNSQNSVVPIGNYNTPDVYSETNDNSRSVNEILIISSVNSNRMSLEIIQQESQVNTTIDYQQSIRQSLKQEKTLFSQVSKRSSNLNASSRLILPPSSRQNNSSRLVKESHQKSSERRPQSSQRKTKKFIQSFRKNTHEHQHQQRKQNQQNRLYNYPQAQNQSTKKSIIYSKIDNNQNSLLNLNFSNESKSSFCYQKNKNKQSTDNPKNIYFFQSSKQRSIKPLSLQKSDKNSAFKINQLEQKFQFVKSRRMNKSIQNVYAHKDRSFKEDYHQEQISRSSSSSDILHFGDTDKINLPLKQQTPKNMMILKKREEKMQRIMTQPSPRLLKSQQDKQNANVCVSHSKITETSKKIFARKRTMTNSSSKESNRTQQQVQPLGNNSNILNISYNTVMNESFSWNNPNNESRHSQSNSRCEYSSAGKNSSASSCKSSHKSKSKQKIKVTSKSKIVQEFNKLSYPYQDQASYNSNNPFKKNHKIKSSVHLGGKFHFKKILIDVKEALKKIQVSTGETQVKFQGSTKNNVREGFGRIIYQNGLVFEGQFKYNNREGPGKLILNGVEVFSGEFKDDKLQGQGYIKSMRFMTKFCPPILNQASYYGKLQSNQLEGMGTLFLNSKQKIVTKFSKNVPFGQLTYYGAQDIQFGVWGSQ